MPEFPGPTCWTLIVNVNPLVLLVVIMQQLLILLLFGFPMSSSTMITNNHRSHLQLPSLSAKIFSCADLRFLLLALGILFGLLILDHLPELGITFFLQDSQSRMVNTACHAAKNRPWRSPHLDLQEVLKQLGLAHQVRKSFHRIGELQKSAKIEQVSEKRQQDISMNGPLGIADLVSDGS